MVQSYKIFIKDIPLLLGNDGVRLDGKQFKKLDGSALMQMPSFIDTVSNSAPGQGFYFHTDDPQQTLTNIKSSMELVPAAGGIVWNKQGELLMIYRRGRWDLPKGKIETDESIETAALREVEEECGIGKLRLIQKFDTTYHIYPERNKWLLKETHWFEMLSSDGGEATPQTSEGITKVRWVPKQNISEKMKNTYASIRDLVQKVLETGYMAEAGG
jgi:8-oxo-dGTP pyrophosphatase MutT (NUDIX family)